MTNHPALIMLFYIDMMGVVVSSYDGAGPLLPVVSQ